MAEFLCQHCPTSFMSKDHRDMHERLLHADKLVQPKGYSRADAYQRLEQQLVSWAKNPDSALVSVSLGDLRHVMSAEVSSQ